MTDLKKAPRPALLMSLTALLAVAASLPAHAKDTAGAATIRMAEAKRAGSTVYCLTDGTPLEKGCKTKSAWRKLGVTVRLPAQEDGTILATRADPDKALVEK